MTSAPGRMARSPHVLVVDDEESIRRALTEALRDEGHSMLAAANGREALELLRYEPTVPSIAIVDLMMPVMSGWDLIAVLRRTPRLATMPILVISAMRPRDLPAGVMFLSKPFDLTEICQLIAKHSATSDDDAR